MIHNIEGLGIFCNTTGPYLNRITNFLRFVEALQCLADNTSYAQHLRSLTLLGDLNQLGPNLSSNLGMCGWELVDVKSEEECGTTMITQILLWLWDSQRLQSNWSANLIIFGGPASMIPTLKLIKSRECVRITVISDFMSNMGELTAWMEVSDRVIDLNDFIHSLSQGLQTTFSRYFQAKTSIENSSRSVSPLFWKTNEMSSSPVTTSSFEGITSGSPQTITSPHIQTYSNVHLQPSQEPEQRFSDTLKPNREHLELAEKLKQGVLTRNVAFTVFVLRSIYAKQSQGFRIPSLLNDIPNSNSVESDAVYLLRCVLWCLGGSHGENMLSFKYRMNQNIVRWLVKDLQRRLVSFSKTESFVQFSLSSVQEILRLVPEFDIALEILVTAHAVNPTEVLIPYLRLWMQSDNTRILKYISEFCSKNNIHDHRVQVVEDRLGQGMGSTSSAMNALSLAATSSRLLNLLQLHPQGIIGARIPSLYEKEYGEPIYLHNMRLKDLLLAFDEVEMTSVQGSGDRLFRYLPRRLV